MEWSYQRSEDEPSERTGATGNPKTSLQTEDEPRESELPRNVGMQQVEFQSKILTIRRKSSVVRDRSAHWSSIRVTDGALDEYEVESDRSCLAINTYPAQRKQLPNHLCNLKVLSINSKFKILESLLLIYIKLQSLILVQQHLQTLKLSLFLSHTSSSINTQTHHFNVFISISTQQLPLSQD